MKTTLYIATHNKTGLKYFGKTTCHFTQEDLQKHYHGSGTYWKNHLRKHGDDVTMEIHGIHEIDEVKEIALKFSEDNNIVESELWANLIKEDGIDGVSAGTEPWNKGYVGKQEAWNKGLKSDKASPLKGIKVGPMSDEQKKKISDGKKLEYKNKVHHSKGVPSWNKGIKMPTITCPHCKKVGDKGNMKRWHFDNCKYK